MASIPCEAPESLAFKCEKVLARALKTMSTEVSPMAISLIKMGDRCPPALMLRLLTRVVSQFGVLTTEDIWRENAQIGVTLRKLLIDFVQKVFQHTSSEALRAPRTSYP